MIVKLKGILDSIESDGVVVDVNGVGYWVKVSQKVMTQLDEVGKPIILWIEQVVRQEETHLCGFLSKSDRLCFRQLLNVQGVGVRVALAILSVLTVDELLLAISAQDKTMLTRADGVGPKLASRIVLELKDRLSAPNIQMDKNTDQNISGTSSAIADALLGLVNLGYNRSEAHLAIQKNIGSFGSNVTSSELLRAALKSLSKI